MKNKLFECKNDPIVLLSDNLTETQKINGVCAYYGDKPRPCTIVLDPQSNNPSKVLIHECIHTALFNISKKASLEKISYKINDCEDFVEKLTEELSKVLKFKISNSMDVYNEANMD